MAVSDKDIFEDENLLSQSAKFHHVNHYYYAQKWHISFVSEDGISVVLNFRN